MGWIPLHYRSLARAAADIAAGTIASVPVTRHALARIAALEPRCIPWTSPSLTLPSVRHSDNILLGMQLVGDE